MRDLPNFKLLLSGKKSVSNKAFICKDLMAICLNGACLRVLEG